MRLAISCDHCNGRVMLTEQDTYANTYTCLLCGREWMRHTRQYQEFLALTECIRLAGPEPIKRGRPPRTALPEPATPSEMRARIAQRQQKVVELTKAGRTVTQIAKELGVTHFTVSADRKAMGVQGIATRNIHGDEGRAAVRRMLEEGRTNKEIVAATAYSPSRVKVIRSDWLREQRLTACAT